MDATDSSVLRRRCDVIISARAEVNDNFILAVRAGDVVQAKEIVNRYGLPHCPAWDDGYLLLCEALHYNHTGVAELLISCGAKLNSAANMACLPPLHYAIINNDIHIVEALLERGAFVNALSQLGETALYVAATLGHLEITKVLVDSGASLNEQTTNGCTAMHSAAYFGHLDTVKFLLQKGAEVDPKNHRLETPFSMASRNEHSGVCEILLHYNANSNPLVDGGATLLHISAEDGNQKWTKTLLNSGCSVNAQMENGSTALHQAIRNGQQDVVPILLDAGAAVNTADSYGWTALHVACDAATQLDIIQLLLQCSANINAKDVNSSCPLHFAIEGEKNELTQFLLDSGANVNAERCDGNTPLHMAAEMVQPQLVNMLLQFGADINLTNSEGNTPFTLTLAKNINNVENLDLFTQNLFENIKTFTRLIVKMQFAKLDVNVENAVALEHAEAKDYSARCVEEITRMSTEFITYSNLSIFDILVKDTQALARYLRNPEVVEDFTSKNIFENYPLYGVDINDKFRKGLEAKSLLGRCTSVLLSLFPNLPRICIEIIAEFLRVDAAKTLVDGKAKSGTINDGRNKK